MRKLLLAALLPLAACNYSAPVGTLPAPVSVANRTTADETIYRAAESGYKVWRVLATEGVRIGWIKGATATKVAALDNQIYATLQLVERAYDTANSTDLITGAQNLAALLRQGAAIVKGN